MHTQIWWRGDGGVGNINYQDIKKEGPYAINVPSPRKTHRSICTAHAVEQIEKYLEAPEKWSVVEHQDRFPREVVESPLLEIFKTKTRYSPEPPAVDDPALSRGVGLGILQRPLLTSVIL